MGLQVVRGKYLSSVATGPEGDRTTLKWATTYYYRRRSFKTPEKLHVKLFCTRVSCLNDLKMFHSCYNMLTSLNLRSSGASYMTDHAVYLNLIMSSMRFSSYFSVKKLVKFDVLWGLKPTKNKNDWNNELCVRQHATYCKPYGNLVNK